MFAGIDVGSATTKSVLLDQNGVIISSHIIPSGKDFRRSAQAVLNEALDKAKLSIGDIVSTVTTGYGRFVTGLQSKAVTEISCCGRGAFFLCPTARTIIDVGGQDSKAIRINGSGRVIDFALNDKCAAGTGRFLERIATSLEIGLDNMAELSVNSPTKLPISSTCTVFAETEVVSRISSGEPIESIVRGLHNALASRIYTLVARLVIEEDIFMCGGGAKNAGLVKELKEMLGEIILPDIEPRLVSALGAALIARERYLGDIQLKPQHKSLSKR